MATGTHESVDPRIRRTRLLLQDALVKLLEKKDFDEISVQDIAEAATVNRVTFYDHYPDKFALLNCVVAGQFHKLLSERSVKFDGTCSSAVTGIVLAVCDYLAGTPGAECARQKQMESHLESAIIAVVRGMILEGLKSHPSAKSVAPEMIAATASWAIYGAAKEWVQTPDRPASEQIAGTMVAMVSPILGFAHASV